jgi:NTE family protein
MVGTCEVPIPPMILAIAAILLACFRRVTALWGKHDHTVLVLQGGGALGAYQAGVFEGLAECGASPDWVAGVSIGAINAALIAGNPPERRVERLREFWHRVSAQQPFTPPAWMDSMRPLFDQMSSATALLFGVPGFFSPRPVPPFLALDGSIGALSFYDTTPLKATLEELVDFSLINRDSGVRLSLGAVHLSTGNSVYFDSTTTRIGAEHVLASGALPPGFPPIEIDGELYWDGGIVSNSPLWYVLDADSTMNALIFQVDVFSARGEAPRNLAEVQERAKDIQYASKTRFNTNRVKEIEALRGALGRVLGKLPRALHDDPDVKMLAVASKPKAISLVHFINRHHPRATSFKDAEFSRATVTELWQGGLGDVRRAHADPQWHRATDVTEGGVRVYDMGPRT